MLVTPPSTPEKKVNDKEAVELENRTEEFTYTVSQKILPKATKVIFEDELESVLEVIEATIDLAGAEVVVDGNKVVATAEDADGNEIVTNARGSVVTLTIVAKIRDGITDEELIEKYGSTTVPNKAKVGFNNKPAVDTNEVGVTPPSDPEKKINGDTELVELEERPETFTYTVTQTIPAGATKVVFEDELESVLEVVGTPTIDLDGAEVVVDGNKVVATAEGSEEAPVVKKDTIATLTIVAKIRDEVTDDELIAKYESTVVPNKATVTIDDKSKFTNIVKVTPPDEPGDEPQKKVNGVDHVILVDRPETFTYTISQKLPGDAKTATFEDVLEDVLEVVGEPTIDGAATYTISVEGQKVTATSNNVIADRNKTVTLTIQAKIKEGISDEDLIAKYGSTNVPNEATVTINGKGKGTNTVPVTPPSNPDKKVNGVEAYELETRPETFTYTITQLVPSAAETVTFEDELESVLEVVGEPTIDGAAAYTITVVGNKVTAATEDATADREKEVTLTIKAKIRDEVTDADLIAKYGSTTVPNKATVTINNKPSTTNTVTVTPPDEPGSDPEKKVDGELSLALGTRDQVFTYTVSQTFPGDAKTASFYDMLEDVLEIVGEPTIDGKGTYEIKVKGNVVTAVGSNVIADRNETVTLTIQAKIRNDVTDEQLIAKYGSTTVPNVAEVSVNNNPKTTNEVEVTPPDNPREDPEKEINGQKELVELESRPDEFTYTVSQVIPAGAKNVVFEDTLEDVLEIVGTPSMNCDDAVVTVDGNKVVATIEDARGYEGQTLTLTIVAKISDSVGDADLIAKYGSTTVPNKAVVTINDIPRTTNEVKVVPPVEDKEIVKTVNNAQHADLNAADEVFTYDIEVYVPADAEKMTITDKLVDELQFETAADDVSVTVDGEEIKATKTIDGQLLTVEVATSKPATEEAEETEEGDDAAADDAAAAADEAAEKAAAAQAKADELEEAAQAAEAAAADAAAAAAEARAAADAAAEEAAAAKAAAEEAAAANDDAANDEAADEEAEAEGEIVDLRGKTIKVTFQASIKAGADLSKYLDANGNPNVPNTANYIVNDDPDRSYESNTVTVTPPTPPADEPEKFINDMKGALELAERTDTFVYTIAQRMPYNAVSAVFEDQIEDVLEVVSVEIDGAAEYVDETVGNLVRFTTSDASADRNSVVTMTIVAKLRDGVTDEELIAKYGTTNVPNKATVAINGNPQATNEVVVTPPPTIPEPPTPYNPPTPDPTPDPEPEPTPDPTPDPEPEPTPEPEPPVNTPPTVTQNPPTPATPSVARLGDVKTSDAFGPVVAGLSALALIAVMLVLVSLRRRTAQGEKAGRE